MSLAIAWSPAALWVFYRLPMHSATILDRAVIRLAETGEGELGSEPPYHRLRAGTFDVLISIDRSARRLTVLHVYRTR